MLNTALLLTLSLLVASPPRGEESRKGPDSPQEDPAGIAMALEARDPSWVLKRQETAAERSTYAFVRDGQQLFVTVNADASEQDAKSRFEAFAMTITAVPTEVRGVGQQCLIWTDPVSGVSTLAFRRGRKFFHLTGPSKEESIRVARHLDESLKP